MRCSFAEDGGFRKQRKITRREAFLAERERVVPGRRLESLIELYYPLAGKGRKPYWLSTMSRVHLLQHWYGYPDPGMEEALHDIPALRRFAWLDAGWHSGRKAHIGVDTAHGLVHTLDVATGKVSGYSMAETSLLGDEQTAHGDRGYADKTREPDRVCEADEAGPRWFVPFKRMKGCDTTPEQNRLKAALRSAAGHPFRVL